MHETGMVEPSPMVIVEKAEGKQADNKFIFEDICIDAPESKIQSVPEFPCAAKLFMGGRKAAWSQLGVEVEAGVVMGAFGCGGVGSRADIVIKRETPSLYCCM